MLLPKGVTGMWSHADGPANFTDYQAFRSDCYAMARDVGAIVQTIQTPRLTMACNYALALFRVHDLEINVVLNGVLPLLAFASPANDWEPALDFMDHTQLANAFLRHGGYTVLKAEQVRQPLTQEMCLDLAEHEQRSVRYFRPKRVGDVLFNYWD